MSTTSKPLPMASVHLLLALLDGEQHGYSLMRRVSELSSGAVNMGPGTVYGTLNRLVGDGLIVETTDRIARDDGERRRYYQLTANGHTVAVDELVRLQGLVHQVRHHIPRGSDGVTPAARAYGALLHLYPRSFRAEYGLDMVLMFEEQCRDEPVARVGARLVVDLALTVPTQHLEQHMNRRPTTAIVALYAGVAVAGLALAALGGSNPATLLIGIVIALVAAALAIAAGRQTAPAAPGAGASWWKFLLTAPLLVGGVILAAGLGVDSWYLGMIVVLVAIALFATGLILAVIRLLHRRPATA